MTMFAGSVVTLVTPFSGREIDERALASWQMREGSAAIAVNTVMGEVSTLTSDERSLVVSVVRESVGDRLPVVAGVCTNCTVRGVDEARRAEAAGANALLVVTPHYSRPTQEGVVRHLDEIARATDLPMLVHNDPARTRVDLTSESAVRLLSRENVVGFVDGTGDATRALWPVDPTCRPMKTFTSRDDATIPFLACGGTGTLSALANLVPRLCTELHAAVRSGSATRVRSLRQAMRPMAEALGADPDPAAIKYALFLMRDGIDPTPRLPLVPASCGTARTIAAAVAAMSDDIADRRCSR